MEGSRIINLDQLQLYTENISKHASQCSGSVVLNGESRDGLASILSAKCTTCSHVIAFSTSTKVKGPRGYKRWQCNLAAVWGQMVTGRGHSNLKELMSIVGVPVMTNASFVQTERAIGEAWKQELLESMAEAGREEKRLAEQRNEYHEGVPATLLQSVPGWGHAIKKLECANHACKCYRGALERFVQDNPSYKGTGGLTKNQRRRLVAAARSAIRMRSKEKDQGKALSLLQRDLRNGPLHCFGFHRNCSTDFCTTAQKNTSMTSNSVPSAILINALTKKYSAGVYVSMTLALV